MLQARTKMAKSNAISVMPRNDMSFWPALRARCLRWLPFNRFLYHRDGVALPSTRLRAAGPIFRNDRAFCDFARRDIEVITRHTSLAGRSILDFGCGSGRLYFGLRRREEPAFYLGLDVKSDVIAWDRQNITVANTRFNFEQSDVRNERYNPSGGLSNHAWANTLKQLFDIVYCYSVLSHLVETDAREVLDLFLRHAHSDAFIFLTAFVSDQTEEVAINPTGMAVDIQGPLHVVCYNHDYFRDQMLLCYSIVAEYPGAATDGQTLFVLRPRHAGASHT